ncbi:MAG: cell division protein SepF [Lachnospiraceae bacterium]|nr:cell division protein SepF [Lachnospiraceae bacterium]
MSVMDKFLTAMKLNGEDDDYFEDAYEGDYDDRGSDVITPMPRREIKDDMPAVSDEKRRPASSSSVRPMPSNRPRKGGSVMQQGMEICAIKPTSMEDTREVTDTLLKNRTVVLNLEGIDVDVAQRIVDFVSGSCYAIKGNLQKISRYIFIITPASVDISGDFQEMIGGFSGDAGNAGNAN